MSIATSATARKPPPALRLTWGHLNRDSADPTKTSAGAAIDMGAYQS